MAAVARGRVLHRSSDLDLRKVELPVDRVQDLLDQHRRIDDLAHSSNMMGRTQSSVQSHFRIEASFAGNAGNTPENNGGLVRIWGNRSRVIRPGELGDQTRVPATQHPVNFGSGTTWVALHGRQQFNSHPIRLVGETPGHEIVWVNSAHLVGP